MERRIKEKKIILLGWDKTSLIIEKIKILLLLLLLFEKTGEGESDKIQETQVMPNTIAHHWLTYDGQTGPSQPAPPGLYTDHDIPWYGISFWPVQVCRSGGAPS